MGSRKKRESRTGAFHFGRSLPEMPRGGYLRMCAWPCAGARKADGDDSACPDSVEFAAKIALEFVSQELSRQLTKEVDLQTPGGRFRI